MDFETDPETGGILLPLKSKSMPGMFAIVDESDVDMLSQFIWWPMRDKSVKAVRHYAQSSHFGRRVGMHRVILGVSDPKKIVDHINGNSLDNRRSNLRIVTGQQNQFNRKATKGTSAFKGVYWNRMASRWNARIYANGRKLHLGYFDDETEAARAFDAAARELQGEYAYLNFPEAQS